MLVLLLAMATTDINGAIAQAINPCPIAPKAGEISVCARDKAAMDRRFRIQDEDHGFDPLGTVDSVSRERHRLIDGDGASPDLTRGSCSPVGASGATGCDIKKWRENDQKKGW